MAFLTKRLNGYVAPSGATRRHLKPDVVVDTWTPEKKLQAVSETLSLSEESLGAYLREHGLHSSDLETWRSECLKSFRGPGRPRKDPKLAAIQKEKKSLERDMRRKDKALSEMTARIVLLKKSRLLWGVDEEGES